MSISETEKFRVGSRVWKQGRLGGYEGPGTVVAMFKNWMGQQRYVVSHKIEDGRGCFYHIYSDKELSLYSHDTPDTVETT